MAGEHQESVRFERPAAFKEWVDANEWYQTIHLKGGVTTPGKFRTDKRLEDFKKLTLAGKSVLDIGCNSGQYSLFSKAQGAARVVGLEPNEIRIQQARILAEYEGLDIEFVKGGIERVPELGRFDVVFCIAVLTEIQDVLGGLKIIGGAIEERGVLELGIARPVFYFPKNGRWLFGRHRISRKRHVGEFYRHKHAGWVIFPPIEVIRDVFGDEFLVIDEGRGLRYDRVQVVRAGA